MFFVLNYIIVQDINLNVVMLNVYIHIVNKLFLVYFLYLLAYFNYTQVQIFLNKNQVIKIYSLVLK
jgi:hypothetical protein